MTSYGQSIPNCLSGFRRSSCNLSNIACTHQKGCRIEPRLKGQRLKEERQGSSPAAHHELWWGRPPDLPTPEPRCSWSDTLRFSSAPHTGLRIHPRLEHTQRALHTSPHHSPICQGRNRAGPRQWSHATLRRQRGEDAYAGSNYHHCHYRSHCYGDWRSGEVSRMTA